MTPSTIEDANKCSTLSPVKSKSLPSTPTDQSNNIMVVLPNKEKNNTTKEVEKNGSFIKPKPYVQGNGNISDIGNGIVNGNGKDEGDDATIDDDNNKESGQSNDIAKRFLPAYKKPNAALTFP
eukprot:CAMPEP_0170785044 /NCGR_PEP_ID=MMETSP0733-20121128/16625_1 /TAXON_ID=186038 /ORGANISM="Fragilariopsis kerguelensis, Strain L26-C5" /LENGTH=122 /DNA_ID=CAMNT_0011130329 /DNA_START=31 /DNA_END=396 /DNA_ORIENTATION=+